MSRTRCILEIVEYPLEYILVDQLKEGVAVDIIMSLMPEVTLYVPISVIQSMMRHHVTLIMLRFEDISL